MLTCHELPPPVRMSRGWRVAESLREWELEHRDPVRAWTYRGAFQASADLRRAVDLHCHRITRKAERWLASLPDAHVDLPGRPATSHEALALSRGLQELATRRVSQTRRFTNRRGQADGD